MFLLEHEGKQLFREHGIPVPPGKVVKSVDEAVKAAEEIGYPVVLKPQIPGGRRGQVGAIRFADTPDEVRRHAEELLGMTLHGHKVEMLLVEKKIDIAHEYYLAFLLDFEARAPVLLFSTMGGIEVEELARKYPEKLVKYYLPDLELYEFQIRDVLKKAGIPSAKLRAFTKVIKGLWECFTKRELFLAEINPLVEDKQGNIWALDARVVADDNAEYRQPWLTRFKETRTGWERDEIEAKRRGVSYVVLSATGIASIVNGAGLAMATCDCIKNLGGEPANFLDVGGGASADRVVTAFELIKRLGAKVILINIFGGITRCDEIARGIVEALKRVKLDIPLVVRLTGTLEEEGRRILEQHGIKVYTDMLEAIKTAVELAKSR